LTDKSYRSAVLKKIKQSDRGVYNYESQIIGKENLRQVQNHQKKRQNYGHLQQGQKPQAKTGLIPFRFQNIQA
jgi:hypothetical protein